MTRLLSLVLLLHGSTAFLLPGVLPARALSVDRPRAAPYLATPNSPTSGVSALSVNELKRLLSERGVDFRDCLEKSDLIERLQSSSSVTRRSASPSTLMDSETRLVSTFQRVSPSVAYIQTSAVAPTPFSLRPMEVPAGAGSGFLWDDQGHVVTNYHVIASNGPVPNKVKVKLQGVTTAYDAQVVGMEPDKDLAVLKISSGALPPAIEVGTSNDLQVGQTVLAIGNPFGLDYTLTQGARCDLLRVDVPFYTEPKHAS